MEAHYSVSRLTHVLAGEPDSTSPGHAIADALLLPSAWRDPPEEGKEAPISSYVMVLPARERGIEKPLMLGRIFTVGGYTLLSRLTGFARDIMLAAMLGAGPAGDAFFVAWRLPNHFRAIFAEGGLPASESLSEDVISLPMHAYLDEPTQERVIQAVRSAVGV